MSKGGRTNYKEEQMGLDFTGIGSVFDFAKGIVDRIWPPDADPNQKMQAQMALQEMIEQRENQIVDAQKSIMVAEMNQGDAYTKRARPTIVYAGLAFIFLVNVAFPIIHAFTGTVAPSISLPAEFWWAWSGVCGVWVIGRSAEKRGAANKLTNMITGSVQK
jgi:hypothetical protein